MIGFDGWSQRVCARLTIRSQVPVEYLIVPGLLDMWASGMSTKEAADQIYPGLFLF